MALDTLETIVFKNKKQTLYNFAVLFIFVYLLPSIANYRSNMTKILSYRCTKFNVFKEFVMNLLASTPFFLQKL